MDGSVNLQIPETPLAPPQNTSVLAIPHNKVTLIPESPVPSSLPDPDPTHSPRSLPTSPRGAPSAHRTRARSSPPQNKQKRNKATANKGTKQTKLVLSSNANVYSSIVQHVASSISIEPSKESSGIPKKRKREKSQFIEPFLAPQGVFPPPLTSTVPSLQLTELACFYLPSLRCLTRDPNAVYSVSYQPWLATNREYVMCFHTNFTRLHKNPVWLLGSLLCTSVDLQKWGLCCSPSTGPCQIPDVYGHTTTAKGFTFCRCAELRPAPLTCANLLFAATTTCSFLTVRSRLYQRQRISASSQPSATRALVIWLQSFTMDKCLIPQTRRCAMRFWHRLIDDSQLLHMEDLPAQTYLGHRYFRETLQQACKIPTTRPCAPGRTPVGWSACGEFAAAFPTVSVLRGVVTVRGAIDLSRHASTAKGFTFCRCAELRPAALTCANLLFAATTTCSFLTVRSRLYQRQRISASS